LENIVSLFILVKCIVINISLLFVFWFLVYNIQIVLSEKLRLPRKLSKHHRKMIDRSFLCVIQIAWKSSIFDYQRHNSILHITFMPDQFRELQHDLNFLHMQFFDDQPVNLSSVAIIASLCAKSCASLFAKKSCASFIARGCH
jgi:hypothetical protein